MSGGVDSATAAARAVDAGHEVTGDVDALGLVIREAVDRARRAARA